MQLNLHRTKYHGAAAAINKIHNKVLFEINV